MSLLDDVAKAAELTRRQKQGKEAYEKTMGKYDLPSGQVGFRMEATPITRKKEADGANPSAVPVSPMVLPTATQPAVLPRFLPVTDTSAQATYAFEQVRGTQLSPQEEAKRTQQSVDRLNIQIEAAQKQTDEAWRKADAYSRMNIPQEEITAAAMEYNAANTRLQNLTAQRDRMASGYYQQENESTLQKLSGNSAYSEAKQLQKDIDNIKQGMNLLDIQRRYAGQLQQMNTLDPERLLPQLKKQLKESEKLLEAAGYDFQRLYEYEQRQAEVPVAAERKAQTEAFAKKHPVIASAGSVLLSPLQGVDFLRMLGTGKGSVQDVENYVPYNANNMAGVETVQAIRGAVSEEIAGSVENENWGKALQFLYNTGMSIGDSALQVAAFGPGATYLMGMSAAANQSRDILERGGTNGQAIWGGLAAGAAEAIFEKFSIDRLLSPKAGEKFFKSLLKQAGVEASEEMATEIANILTDAAIMGQRSEFAESVRVYQQQGMTEQQAKQQAFLDAIGQVALAGLGGAISGGVMGGGVSGLNAIANGGRTQNTDVDVKRAEEIAKRFGAELRIGTIENGSAGEYQDGVITIDPTKGNPVRQVLIHELTHHMETSGLYGEFAQMMLDYAGNTMQLDVADLQQRIMQEYAAGGIMLDEMGAQRELVAKIAEGRLFQDEAAIRQLAQTNRNLFQRIYQWIRETAIKLRGTQEQQFLLDAQKLYEKALQGVGMTQANAQAQNLYAGTGARNADLDALTRAQEMEAAGTDAEAIRRETGWHRGAEGKWRWEIDDSGIQYSPYGGLDRNDTEQYARWRELEERMRDGGALSYEEGNERAKLFLYGHGEETPNTLLRRNLDSFINHPELFEAYPELRDVTIRFREMEPGKMGSYDPNGKVVTISNELRDAPEETLLHEIQHAIQMEEDFAQGSNVKYWQRRIDEGMDARRANVRQEEARLRQELENIREQEPEFYADMMALNEIAPTVPRGAINWDTLEKIEEDPIEWQTYDAQRDALEEKYGDMKVWDFNDLLYNIQRLQTNEGRNANELYRDTAGEIEARDVSARRTMTAEERKNTAPNLGGEDVVFAEGGIVSAYDVDLSNVVPATRKEALGLEATDARNVARYKKEVNDALNGKMPSDQLILIGRPSEVLQKYLGNNNPLYMPQNAAKKAALTKEQGGKHGLGPVVVEDLPYQFEDPMAITGNTSRHAEFNDNSIVVWTDWKTTSGASVIVPIRIDARGAVGTYNNVNTTFDAYDPEYAADLLREGNIIYTRNNENIQELTEQRREVPKFEFKDVSKNSITDSAGEVNTENSYGRSFDELAAAQRAELTQEQKGTAAAVPKAQAMIEAGEPVYRIVEETGLHQGEDGELHDQFGNVVTETAESVTETAESVVETAEDVTDEERLANMPSKARKAVQSSENRLTARLAGILSVPRQAQREFLKPITQKLVDGYLRSGTVDDQTMRELFDEAWEAGIVVDDEFYKTYKDLKDRLRTQGISISEELGADLQGYENLEQFRRAHFGTLNIKKDGLPVDVVYQELQESYPGLFPEDVTNPADQLMHIAEVARSIRKVERHLDEYYGENAEEFKRWAMNDFYAAAGDAISQVALAKRYADDAAARRKIKSELTPEQVKQHYKAMKDARRAYEKVQRKTLLTQEDQRIVDKLLKGEMEPSGVRGACRDAILQTYEAKAEYEKYARELRQYNAAKRQILRDRADEMLGEANTWKDKRSGLAYSRETMERNVRDIADEKSAEKIIREYFEPVHRNEAASSQFKNMMRDMVREMNLSRKAEKGNEVSEAYAVQLIGEARSAIEYLSEHPDVEQREGKTMADWQGVLDDVAANNPKLDMAKIDKAIEQFRSMYNAMFEQMNEVRIRNGYEPVDYRQGYFPHFQKDQQDGLLGMFGKALGIQTEVTDLPTSINGITHTFKPGIQWFGHGKQRKGFDTEYDAVQGFDKYIEGVANVIYHTDDIQRLRALATQMRYRTTDEGIQEQIDKIESDPTLTPDVKDVMLEKIAENGRFALSNFVVEMDEYTNLLAGKKSRHDRSAETNWGRPIYNLVKGLESRVAANMVAVNPGSWLTNFIPITQAWGAVDTASMLEGMWDTLKAYKEDDGMVGRSVFLTNRRGSDPLVRTWGQKASATMSKPMEYIDQFTADTIVRARYKQNIKRGLSETEAMREADSFTAGVMADRSKGSMPTLFERRNPATKLITQFQLEVNNQLSYLFKDLPREKREKGLGALAAALLKFAIGAFLYNEVYEYIIGRRPALDPIGILNDAAGDWIGYELPNLVKLGVGALKGEAPRFKTEKKGAYEALAGTAESVAENLPFTSAAGLLGIEVDNARLPAYNAIPDLVNLGRAATDRDWSGKKRWAALRKEIAKPATYLALPFGGGQLKKAIQTIDAVVNRGSYSVNTAGEKQLQYPVYADTAGDAVMSVAQGVLFGKTALPTGREWIESGFKTIGTKETAVYQALVEDLDVRDRDAYQILQELRGIGKAGDATSTTRKRAYLWTSDMSDEAKAAIYYGLLATESELEAWKEQTEMGADDVAIYNTMQAMRGETKSAGKMGVIFSSDLTDEQQLALYYDMVASDARKDTVDKMVEAGIAPGQVADAIMQHGAISESDAGATQKATEFAYWVDRQGFTAAQEEIINDELGFSSGFRAGATKYNELKAAGLTDNKAMSVVQRQQDLTPEQGKSTVSDQQKYTDIAGMYDLSDEDKLKAIKVIDSSTGDTVWKKYSDAVDAGLSVQEYDEYRVKVSGITSDKDANGKTISGSKKEKVIAAIHAMNISSEEKDFLYLQEGYAEKGIEDAPWHTRKWELPTAANGFQGTGRSGGIRSKNTIRGKNSLR